MMCTGLATRQLLIEPAGGAQRLLAVRHLVGQAIARLELQVAAANTRTARTDEAGRSGRATTRSTIQPTMTPSPSISRSAGALAFASLPRCG
jgi:hypothetical protein